MKSFAKSSLVITIGGCYLQGEEGICQIIILVSRRPIILNFIKLYDASYFAKDTANVYSGGSQASRPLPT